MLNFIINFVKLNREIIIVLFIFLPSFIVFINTSFLLIIIISVILSYFLYKLEKIFIQIGVSEKISFISIYLFFFMLFPLLFSILIPIVFKQLVILFNDLPFIIQKIKIITYKIIKYYPNFFPKEQTNILFSNVILYVQSVGKTVINASLLSIVIITKWIVYIFLIPILIFFFSKDHQKIMKTFRITMPEKSKFWSNIWDTTYIQLNNYVRGKIIEVFIVTFITLILFRYYNIVYSDLLAFIVGVSVIVPYVGIMFVSIPIFFISSIQLGFSNDFFYMITFYIVIQFLDGNLLVPILFSEAVKLHPITIIFSVIVLGSLFKVYGLFFAIPIAIIIKAIIKLYFFPNIQSEDN